MLKKRLMIASLVFMLVALSATSGFAAKGMMVLVTSPEPQTQLMSMVLSSQVAKQGSEVKVLLCGPAGDLVVKGSAETILKPRNVSPQMLLRKLIGKGVPVQVCPLYLPNAGKTASDLIEGVTVAKPPKIAEELMAPGVKLLNF